MPEQTPTLRDMVNTALASGKTYSDLEKRATDPVTGAKASRGFLNRLAHGAVTQAPLPHHLRAIAAALGKPYEEVRRAAIAQWLPAEAGSGEAQREQLVTELRELRTLAGRVEALLDRAERPDDNDKERTA